MQASMGGEEGRGGSKNTRTNHQLSEIWTENKEFQGSSERKKKKKKKEKREMG
jgi:hypothetical protein